MSAPEITVGIPCYSGAEDLLPWCLQAIRDRSGDVSAYDLVVVDDSGRADHQQKSRRVAERFSARWLGHDRNLGITAGWNTLCRSSSSSLLALLNDDIIVAPGWLEALTYFLRENPGAGAVGLNFFFITRDDVPALLSAPTATVTPRHHFTKVPLRPEEYAWRGTENPGCIMCPTGCAFGFTRDKYNLVGGFDPRARQFYNESWFGTALAAAGHPSYMIPHPLFFHIWSATFSRSKELMVGGPMARDREAYKQHFGGDFDVTDPRYMAPFRGAENAREVRWLGPDGQPRSAKVHA